MREKYYVIEIYDEKLDDRYAIYRTDVGIFAFFKWWQLKFFTNFKYQVMTIRD